MSESEGRNLAGEVKSRNEDDFHFLFTLKRAVFQSLKCNILSVLLPSVFFFRRKSVRHEINEMTSHATSKAHNLVALLLHGRECGRGKVKVFFFSSFPERKSNEKVN